MRNSRPLTIFMLLVSACAIICLVYQLVRNPMHKRSAVLMERIESIPEPSPYYLERSEADYIALQNTFKAKPKVWDQLVPGARSPKSQEAPPNFWAILKDVVASKRKEMKAGDDVKVHVVSPEKPYGQWLGVGDVIRGCKIISITPDFLIVEKYKGKNQYAHKYPRK